MRLDALVHELSIFLLEQNTTKPFVFGISGGQGAGKSTLCQPLKKDCGAKKDHPNPFA